MVWMDTPCAVKHVAPAPTLPLIPQAMLHPVHLVLHHPTRPLTTQAMLPPVPQVNHQRTLPPVHPVNHQPTLLPFHLVLHQLHLIHQPTLLPLHPVKHHQHPLPFVKMTLTGILPSATQGKFVTVNGSAGALIVDAPKQMELVQMDMTCARWLVEPVHKDPKVANTFCLLPKSLENSKVIT